MKARLLPIHQLRPFLLGGIAVFIVLQVVALSPTQLDVPGIVTLDPDSLLDHAKPGEVTLAPHVPANQVPAYTVEHFSFVSVTNGQKQWKIEADRAFMFSAQKFVHARNVTAYLYDSKDQATLVTGLEATYYTENRDLEVFGNVKAVMPDGFEITSEYMRYLPKLKTIDIPQKYFARGNGKEESGKLLKFTSQGMRDYMDLGKIDLADQARVTVVEPPKKPSVAVPHPQPQETLVVSDRAQIERPIKKVYFTMHPTRKESENFVQIFQPTLYCKGRKSDLNYGDGNQKIHFMTVESDVLVQELEDPNDPASTKNADGKVVSRYGTGGVALFNNENDTVTLKEFPQLYQDDDTVIGDVIVMHRDTDQVEVENSNAFSAGQQQAKPSSK